MIIIIREEILKIYALKESPIRRVYDIVYDIYENNM